MVLFLLQKLGAYNDNVDGRPVIRRFVGGGFVPVSVSDVGKLE